ncbi:MAG: hypothetical protein HC905_11620 [Bacteroidales bacterium]|nr:hypothetical protein [Bacteroidales bacterium]
MFRSFLFAVSVGIIAFLFPREGRFPYEFQKSKPWIHPDLYAPFDFPVLKTVEELRTEKDSLIQQFRPYFNYTEGIDSVQLELFKQAFLHQWESYKKDSAEFRNKNKRQLVQSYFRM